MKISYTRARRSYWSDGNVLKVDCGDDMMMMLYDDIAQLGNLLKIVDLYI